MHQSKPHKAPTGTSNKSSGVVRIIGGEMRGRKLRFNASEGLRPTLDRVRETVFNWLARDLPGRNCLDLFAGSGAMGFEALSRGAAQVYLVEKSAKVVRDLKHNCELLAAKNVRVVNLESAVFLKSNEQKFDVVFLDPPFGKGLLKETLDALIDHINDDALIYIEQEKSAQEFIPDDKWLQLKYKKTGSFSYALYTRNLSAD